MAIELMTGDTSALGFDQDTKAADYYKNALAYLQGSETAKNLIKELEGYKTATLLLVAKDCFPMFCHYEMATQHGFAGSVIVWDPVGLISARAGSQCTYQSPAIALIHEIGHGVQWIKKHEWYLQKQSAAMQGSDAAKLEIENDNIATHETPVAQQLKEGVRKDYNDSLSSAGLAEAKKYYKTPYSLLALAHK
jgi:hypothetical protein